MKILKAILLFFIIFFLVLSIAVVIFIKTFDVNIYRPLIIAKASDVLSRPVDFETANLAFSFTHGLSLKIKDLTIAEDPSFKKAQFLSVKEVSLGVDLLGYLFKKKINISNIIIDSASITIIRKKDASLNVLSLAQAAAGRLQKESGPVQPMAAVAGSAFLISSLNFNNASLTYIDETFEPELNLKLSKINISVDKLSFIEAFPFSAEAAFLSSRKNIKVNGKALINLETNQIDILELKANSDLSLINLKEVPVTFPKVKEIVLPKSLKGNLELDLSKLTVERCGLSDLSAELTLTGAYLEFEQIATAIRDVQFSFNLTEDKILLYKSQAEIAEGLISLTGEVQDYLSGQDYNFESEARNLKIQDILIQDKSPVQIEGIASGKIKLSGRGFAEQAVQSNLSGKAQVSLQKAKLKNINILRTVLNKISVIPGLAEEFEEKLPERFKHKLTQKDTILSDIKLPIDIRGGQFIINDAVFAADEFMFNGKGQAGFDGTYALEGSFLIPEDLSKSMISVADKLAYLLNSENQIYIPLRVTGKATDLTFIVDIEYIAKRLLADQARKQLFKIIDKALGVEEEPKQPQAEEVQQEEMKAEETKQETANEITPEEFIGSILRDILE